MPRRATHLLRWSAERGGYELLREGQQLQPPVEPDSPAWFAWLADVASFSFQRATGEIITLRREKVQRGGSYWYAYSRLNGQMTKRYLGRDGDLTLARLESAPPHHERYVTNTDAAPPKRRPRTARAKPPATEDAPLLATRMLMPRTPSRMVSRTHVWHRLQRGLERPLTLLTAPPGFGKTTALAAWVRQMDRQETPVAWVSLDASDNEPGQFWAYLLSALEQAAPGVTGGALAMLRAVQSPPLTIILRALLNALAASPREIVLVLDDYHRITLPAIHETVAALLEHPPAQFHLYIASRHASPLPLARLRARDAVNEIDADDLRFRLDEVAEFLADVMEVRLPFADVLALAERTDGWIAGLQLAGLSLRHHPDPEAYVASFSGSQRHIMQYLGDEVLATQPSDVHDFLLHTSILDRLSGPLCDAVTGGSDGRLMLDRLARANLFVVALDDEGRWYRYYHLFADLLRHHLHEKSPGLVAELHRRAARWLESDGQITEAAQHLSAIPDYAAYADLVERVSDDLFRKGDLPTTRALLDQLPDEVLRDRPILALTYAEACYARGELAAADQHITVAEQAVARMTPATEAEERQRRMLIGRIACNRAVLSSMRGDADATIAYVQTMQEYLPEDDLLRRGGGYIPAGHAWRLKGNLAAADEAYAEAVRLSAQAGSPFLEALALDMRILVASTRGELRLAADLARQIIAMADSRGAAARALAGNAWAALGWRLSEWNDLAGAEDAFRRAIALGEEWDNIENQIHGHLWLTLIYGARHEPEEARTSFQRAHDLLAAAEREGRSFPWMPPLIYSVAVHLAIRQGKLAEAERWAAQLQKDRRGNVAVRPLVELTCAHLLLAQGKPVEAQMLIDPILAALTPRTKITEVEIRVLQTLTLQATGKTEQALETLTMLLTLAQPEGYIRTFINEGAPMVALLAELRSRQEAGSELAAYIDQLLAAAASETTPILANGRTPSPLPEPLSGREREVLGLLAEGYSNQDIADHLVVALSTVKTHVHHLYAKLQAPDRLRAVTQARRLGLLDEDEQTIALRRSRA